MVETTHSHAGSNTPPHEWLRRIVAAKFPSIDAISSITLPPALGEAWTLVTSLAPINDEELAELVARACGLSTAKGEPQGAFLAKVLPEQIAQRNGVAPLAVEADGRLVIISASPQANESLQEIRFATGGKTVEVRIAAPQTVEGARVAVYGGAVASKSTVQGKILDLDNDSIEASLPGDIQLVRFCRSLIKQAILRRASDIHIHSIASTGVVRFRIDGQLIRAAAISLTVMAAAIRLIKAQGAMDSTNSLIPQDGRASILFQNRRYDLRISTLPTSGTEAIVIRVLDQSRTFDLERTNFAPWALDALRRLSANANGLVLITGPTGSGKTSTLYSLLTSLNKTTRRIITLEEPVEYQLQGLTQVEVNNATGVTFQRALRSILRQDPDILLIGEIRDSETAKIAVQAAMTGHLVFSTLHTQDSVRAIPRLVDLGVPPEMLADTLLGVISQRLMRRLCEHCKSPVTDPLQPIEELFAHVSKSRPAARAVGCKECDYTGYHGRFPVVEALEVPDSMRSKLLQGHSDTTSLMETIPSHWRSIEANAANWVISGLTTPTEAFDCIGLRLWTNLSKRNSVDAPIGSFLGTDAAKNIVHPTVLIISSNKEVSHELSNRLGNIGEASISVTTAEEALSALHREHQLHLLIVDISDRDPDRRKKVQRIRTSVAWSGLRTLVIYDRTEEGIVQRIEDFGIHTHLPVPVEGNHFELKVKKLLSIG